MSAITYTAKRSLISGHSAETEYDMDVAMEEITEQDISLNDQEHEALDGTTEGLFYAAVVKYTVSTAPLGDNANGDFAKMREFITSVFGSAQFTFDPYGTVASPANPKTCVLIPNSVTYERVHPVAGTSQPAISVSFGIRTVP